MPHRHGSYCRLSPTSAGPAWPSPALNLFIPVMSRGPAIRGCLGELSGASGAAAEVAEDVPGLGAHLDSLSARLARPPLCLSPPAVSAVHPASRASHRDRAEPSSCFSCYIWVLSVGDQSPRTFARCWMASPDGGDDRANCGGQLPVAGRLRGSRRCDEFGSCCPSGCQRAVIAVPGGGRRVRRDRARSARAFRRSGRD